MLEHKVKYIIYFFIIFFIASLDIHAQINGNFIIKGVVADAESGEAIPFASISFIDKKDGTLTDFEGKYFFVLKSFSKQMRVSCLGYKTQIIKLNTDKTQIVNIKLKKETKELSEVIVKPPKSKYKNKDNPAVLLIEKVIENRTKNFANDFSFFQFEKYEKTQFALSNISENFKKKKSLRKFNFIFDNIDTTKLAGKEVLPVFLKETISDFFYRNKPESSKEIIKATKMVSFEGYIDNNGMNQYLKYLYQDIDISKSNIMFLTNSFVSPIASEATTLYKYFIIDTTFINSEKCVRLFFSPRNKTDLLLQGDLYIMLDGSYAIKKFEISVNKEINLNWAREVKIIQQFEKQNQTDKWLKVYDEISIDFGIAKNNMGIFGQRALSMRNYNIKDTISDSVFIGQKIITEKMQI